MSEHSIQLRTIAIALSLISLVGCDGAHRLHTAGDDDATDANGDGSNGPPMVQPSNKADVGTLQSTGLTLDVPNAYVFDTTSDCLDGSVLGSCAAVTPIAGPAICVCHVDTLTVHDLEVRGTRALAILASTSVTVSGNVVIDPGVGESAATVVDGSAGGSYASHGGAAETGASAPTWGSPENVPLVGGQHGMNADGGHGGGALQITADATIRIEGSINVPGGGDHNLDCTGTSSGNVIGHGGGSGGALLLEARHVDMIGAVAANGGGGGAGAMVYGDGSVGCGAPGQDGLLSATTAAHGGGGNFIQCHTRTTVARSAGGGGGSIGDDNGGAAGTNEQSGSDPNCTTTVDGVSGEPAGGGGGAGRIRVNTESDPCGCTGMTSPTPTFGTTIVM